MNPSYLMPWPAHLLTPSEIVYLNLLWGSSETKGGRGGESSVSTSCALPAAPHLVLWGSRAAALTVSSLKRGAAQTSRAKRGCLILQSPQGAL